MENTMRYKPTKRGVLAVTFIIGMYLLMGAIESKASCHYPPCGSNSDGSTYGDNADGSEYGSNPDGSNDY
jgi:hypothetical protein